MIKGLFTRTLIQRKNQVVTKKPIWPKVLWSLAITIIVLAIFVAVKPSFTGNGFMDNLKNFFNFGDIHIGRKTVTAAYTFDVTLILLGKTILYSILGTILGIMFAIPISFISSKNVVKKWYIYTPFRVAMSILRAIPPILIGFIFKFAVSDVFAGTIAISVFVTTIMTKWLFEELDSMDFSSYNALRSFGVPKYRALIKSVAPQYSRKLVTYGIYTFEIVIRFAAILGVVGIATIGQLMNDDYSTPDKWGHMTIVLSTLIVFIIILETGSWAFRKYILNRSPKQVENIKGKTRASRIEFVKKASPKIWMVKAAFGLGVFILFIVALTTVDWSIANHSSMVVFKDGMRKLFSPDWTLLTDFSSVENAITLGWEAVLVAGAAVVIGLFFSTILGMLASRNVSGLYVSLIAKGILITIRSIPVFVYAIVFLLLSPENNGIFAGVLALGIHSIGMLGKLTYEKIESMDNGGQIALDVVGANKTQKFRWAILTEAMPTLLSNALYRWEINFKSTVVLGAVGASGFGLAMIGSSQGPTTFDKVGAYIVVTIVFVLILEQISNLGRKYLMEGRILSKDNKILRFFKRKEKIRALEYSKAYNMPFDLKIERIKYNLTKGRRMAKENFDKLTKARSSLQKELENLKTLEYKKIERINSNKKTLLEKQVQLLIENNEELLKSNKAKYVKTNNRRIRAFKRTITRIDNKKDAIVLSGAYSKLFSKYSHN